MKVHQGRNTVIREELRHIHTQKKESQGSKMSGHILSLVYNFISSVAHNSGSILGS
jgi:hypothetical protein